MSTLKYHTEVGGPETPHNGYLRWSNNSKYPLRTSEQLSQSDAYGDTVIVRDYRCFVYDLMQPDHLASYQAVMDRIMSGWYNFHDRRQLPNGMVVLEWTQCYREFPQNRPIT